MRIALSAWRSLFQRPLLQSLIVCLAADPLARFLVEEKRDAAAISFVILPHDFRVRFMVPHLKFPNVDPFLRLQPLHERRHLAAVRSLRPDKFQQKEFLFHAISPFQTQAAAVSILFPPCANTVLPINLATGI
jgi:hypothetical protein